MATKTINTDKEIIIELDVTDVEGIAAMHLEPEEAAAVFASMKTDSQNGVTYEVLNPVVIRYNLSETTSEVV